jgi:hypothetical protein
MSVALTIAFTGLCALVDAGNGKPAHLLLLDAKGAGPVAGMNLPAHAPTLVLNLRALTNPQGSEPTRVFVVAPGTDQIGYWDLTGTEVRVRVQGGGDSGLQFFEPSTGETSWPEVPSSYNDPASWRDPRFVADLRVIGGDGRVHPRFVDEGESGSSLPPAIASRFHLDAGLIEGGIPSQETHRRDLFEFRGGSSEHAWRQALTDTINWTLRSEASAVVIEIVPVAGGPAKRLLLAPSATPHRVFVSNLPVDNGLEADRHHAMSDEEMGALHFGAFYSLLKEAPASMPLPMPLLASAPRRGASGLRPAHCAPVRLNQQ